MNQGMHSCQMFRSTLYHREKAANVEFLRLRSHECTIYETSKPPMYNFTKIRSRECTIFENPVKLTACVVSLFKAVANTYMHACVTRAS